MPNSQEHPRATDPHSNREYGVTRRELLGLAATATLLIALGARSCDTKTEDTKQDSKDILTNPEKTTKFISDYVEISERLAEDPKMPLPYELFLAVGMHESDSGTSELATKANNMHGIVAKDGWKGDVYPDKMTDEQVAAESVPELQKKYGDQFTVLFTYPDGSVRVQHPRDFRKYKNPEDSFADFQKKIYFQNQDGSYRYADVIGYLNNGGRDPKEVARLMVDSDEPGELRYSTGEEWLGLVVNYIDLVQKITGNVSGDTNPNSPKDEPSLPPEKNAIDVETIDFSELNEPRDKALVQTIKKALKSLTIEDYAKFEQSGIEDRSKYVEELIGPAKYNKYYNGTSITVRYLIWHLWANGVSTSDNETDAAPKGRSHEITLTDQIESWANNSGASTQFMMSDNNPSEIWQLTRDPATKAGHIRNGVIDGGKKGREDAGNGNTIGIEVQADSIYDVSAEQFKHLILWTTKMLFDQGLIEDGMLRAESDRAIEHSVIGHGKNSGLEFGIKLQKPTRCSSKTIRLYGHSSLNLTLSST